jgi:hypothetical protein
MSARKAHALRTPLAHPPSGCRSTLARINARNPSGVRRLGLRVVTAPLWGVPSLPADERMSEFRRCCPSAAWDADKILPTPCASRLCTVMS